MENLIFIKAVTGVLVAVSSMLAARVNGIQYQKLRADLLKQFDDALDAQKKFQAHELFYMLTKQRMSFKEIEKLIADEKSYENISALSNYPGIYEYRNGVLNYNKLFDNRFFRWFSKISLVIYSVLMLVVVVGLVVVMVNINDFVGTTIIVSLVVLFSYIGYTSARFIYDDFKIQAKVSVE